MNRREFLKGTLGGVFGAFLTWAGMVRGEEVEPAPDAQDMEQEVSGFIDWVNREVVPTWDGQVSDNVSGDYTDYSPNTGSAYPAWASKGDQVTDAHRCDQGCDGCPHEDCEAYPVQAPESSDNDDEKLQCNWYDTVSGKLWTLSDQGSAFYTEDMGLTWREGLPSDPRVLRGAAWREDDPPFGRWIHWSRDGSNKDGAGTWDDPVATAACAQSIADNPFRV